jgi:hypothetical protein
MCDCQGDHEVPQTDEQALLEIFTQLRVHTGHDFFNYKIATILRRIERRLVSESCPARPITLTICASTHRRLIPVKGPADQRYQFFRDRVCEAWNTSTAKALKARTVRSCPGLGR